MTTLTLQSRDYLRGRDTRVLVSPPMDPAEVNRPTGTVSEPVTLQNALVMETTDTSMVLSGRVPGTIAPSTTITFNKPDGSTVSLVTDSTSVLPYEFQIPFSSGPTSTIPAYSSSSTLIVTNPSMVDVLSINSVNPQFSANEVTSRNFKSGLHTSRRQTSLESSLSLSGKKVVGDIGAQRVALAANEGKKLFFQVIYPDATGIEGWVYTSSTGVSLSMDDDAELSIDFNIDGKSFPLNGYEVIA